MKAGVAQSSVLGPLLLLVYMNDIVDNISSCISLFADDTSLYRTMVTDNDYLILNRDLQTISDWGKRWLVTFNASKTKYMLFSKSGGTANIIPLTFNCMVLEKIHSHKHLGIIFSDDLSWKNHIDGIIIKCSKRLNILKRIQRSVPRLCLENIYLYMIRPIIDYGDTVYDNMTVSLSQDLENIQRQAALACTGGYRHTDHSKLLEELGWDPLSTRRKCHRLFMFFKILNNLTPPYMKSILPDRVIDVAGYNLRNKNNFINPKYDKVTTRFSSKVCQ